MITILQNTHSTLQFAKIFPKTFLKLMHLLGKYDRILMDSLLKFSLVGLMLFCLDY